MPKDLNAEARNSILRLALAGYSSKHISERLRIPEATVKLYMPKPGKHKYDENSGDLR